MNAREKLDEFAEINGMNKNQLIGWSIAADFAEWYVEQVKNCVIPAVIGELTCDSCGCHPNVIYTTSRGRFCEGCKPAS